MAAATRRTSPEKPSMTPTRGQKQGWIDDAAWNLEDRGSLVGRKVTGVSMVLASSAILYHATMAAVRFFESARDAEEEMSKSTYYALLVPVTLPATIAFVYLNWLSASFFKSA